MAAGGPAAGGRRQASSFGRPQAAGTVFGKESFESIPETSRSSVELALGLSEEVKCSLGANFNERRKPAPAQLSLWQASFFFALAC